MAVPGGSSAPNASNTHHFDIQMLATNPPSLTPCLTISYPFHAADQVTE